MVRSLRRDRNTKAVAAMLAMIADERSLTPGWPRHARDAEEALLVTEFCAALERYAVRAAQTKKLGR